MTVKPLCSLYQHQDSDAGAAGRSAKTGDTNLGLWISLMGLSLAGLFISLVCCEKEQLSRQTDEISQSELGYSQPQTVDKTLLVSTPEAFFLFFGSKSVYLINNKHF